MTTMSEWLLLLHFLSLLLLCLSPSSFSTINDPIIVDIVACPPHQIQAFKQFKSEFDTRHCNHNDDFNGVWCDNSTGAVTKLQLGSCLSGTLKANSSLFGFHQLRYLNLSNNNFISSSLPSEFGSLNRLEVLSLSFSGFLGQVPSSVSNLTMLSYLSLSHNELTGGFPFVGNLSKLSVLSLSYNHFSGTINPNSSLFRLHQLRYLNLAFNNFTSSLPLEFGNLKSLEVLVLSSNDFFGQVPPTFRNLSCLTDLYLDQNRLSDSFPPVQNLTSLSRLALAHNRFSGTIPSSLLTMPSLSYLDLGGNNFTGSIELPNSSSSSRLELMYLGNNHFEGNILEAISKLTTLLYLDISFLNTIYPIDLSLFSSLKDLLYLELSGNRITPTSLKSDSGILLNLIGFSLSGCSLREFPNILNNLEKLEFVDISNNQIKGKVSKCLWSLPRLTSVNIRNNSFEGFEGSRDVLVNSSVQILVLDMNNFQGALPNLPLFINAFSAAGNRFRGRIPLSICDRSFLTSLVLSHNNFTGQIPQCLNNMMFVNLRKNKLEGSIPNEFYASASIRTLDVGYNRLTGKLPRSLLNCSALKFLNVEHNKIKDMFPFWLKALPNLNLLALRSNEFYGSISTPDQGPLGFPELRILEISDNKFNGSLPQSYFENWKASTLAMNENGGIYMVYLVNASASVSYTSVDRIDLQYKGLSMQQEKILTSYGAIDFSGNRIEGQIPESIGLLKALIALNFSNNAFSGHIPPSFANLGKLESLDLSSNQLSGTIPNGLGGLSFLAYINVSHNQLKGEIPQGTQITGQHKSSFEGNAGLCGLPLEESCFGTHSPPTQQPTEEDEENEEQVLNWKAVAIGYGPGVLLGLAITQVIASYKPQWLDKITGPNRHRAC